MKKTLRKEHACLQLSKRTSVSADFSQMLQESLSLSLSSLVVKKIIGVAICLGRMWIERVSFEVPQVYTEKTVSP